MTMLTKQDLIDALFDNGCTQTKVEAERMVDMIMDTIAAALADGGGVILRGFGRLYAVERKAGVGRNIRTGAEIKIPAKRVARFKAGAALEELMNA